MAEFLTPDICVIGGGAGGLAVAGRARAHGASVVLVEKGRLGGQALHAASIPAHALAAAARRAQMVRSAGAFGIAGEEPKINARGVFDHVHQVIGGSAPTITPDQLKAQDIELIEAEGRFLDRQTLEAGGRRIRARRFVIATGSRALIPQIAGLSEVPYFTSASIFDNPRKLTHLVIIGAGATAIELAQGFRRLGSAVTVIGDASPLAGFDPELAEVALQRLTDEGVAVRTATAVTAVQMRSLGIGVSIKSAEGEQVLDASHVLVAADREPLLDGLDLEKAGVRREKTDGQRLVLNGSLRTSNRRIYAVGDATGGMPYTHAARHHADIVVKNALFGLPLRLDPALLPTAVFTDPEIAEVGLSEPEARRRNRGDFKVLRLSLAENDRARTERQTYGLVKLVTGPGGRLLGAGIVGTGAAEMISLFGFAIANGMSLRHFRNFVAPYPTLTGIVHGLADAAAEGEAESPLLQRLLAFNRLLP